MGTEDHCPFTAVKPLLTVSLRASDISAMYHSACMTLTANLQRLQGTMKHLGVE